MTTDHEDGIADQWLTYVSECNTARFQAKICSHLHVMSSKSAKERRHLLRLDRTVTRAFAYLITAIGIISTASAGWIADFGARAKPSASDCIIVLGCGLYGSTPSPFLMARLDEGVRLHHEGDAKRIIVSGGRGPGESIAEAQAMRDYLVAAGVPGTDIITEDESTLSTLTNLSNSRIKMNENGLSTAIIVSNAYHLARASLISRRLGIEARFSGVRLSQYPQVELAGFIREMPGLIYSLFLGRCKCRQDD